MRSLKLNEWNIEYETFMQWAQRASVQELKNEYM